MNVTRVVLPVMRERRCGHVISISSGAGLMAFEYSAVYAASKFGLEGWMGAFAQEVAPFGIHTTIVNPSGKTHPTPNGSSPAAGPTSSGVAGKTTPPTTPPGTADTNDSTTKRLGIGLLTGRARRHPYGEPTPSPVRRRWMTAKHVGERLRITGCLARPVSVSDLPSDDVGFCAVELELCPDVVDGESESTNLPELGSVWCPRVARVAVRLVGLHRGELLGEVTADFGRLVGDRCGAVEVDGDAEAPGVLL